MDVVSTQNRAAETETAQGPRRADVGGVVHRSIPSLDGIRCIAILLVIVHHAMTPLQNLNWRWLFAVADNGALGVSLFFVLSGYLITNLLIREQNKRGRIDFRAFYRRRAMRLLPALYVYIGVLLVLSLAGRIDVDRWNLLVAGLNIYNYTSSTAGTPEIAHAWSLSAEWQFYLLWPVVLAWVPRFRVTQIAWAVIVLSPFLRLFTYLLGPAWRSRIGMMIHTQADLLLWGCLLALYWNSPQLALWGRRLCRPAILAAVALFLFVISPVLQIYGRGAYSLLVGQTLTGPLIAILLYWVVREPETWLGRMLNHASLVWIGLISYSLYLWQQLIIWEAEKDGVWGMCLRVLCLLVVAVASYYLVEQRRTHRSRDASSPSASGVDLHGLVEKAGDLGD